MVRWPTTSPSPSPSPPHPCSYNDRSMHQRQHQPPRPMSSSRRAPTAARFTLNPFSATSRFTTGARENPALSSAMPAGLSYSSSKGGLTSTNTQEGQPMFFGMPLKYVSLLTLAVQNAALTIVMHYSRVSIPASEAYSPATAVLLNELIKGSISFLIAFMRVPSNPPSSPTARRFMNSSISRGGLSLATQLRVLCAEIFAPDCIKLSIPAILYVIQNSLQFVAISNLPVASFQVAYQMKILTTAAFSVALLRKRLTNMKWLSLFFLALGVGIVQIQTATAIVPPQALPKVVGSAAAAAPHLHVMNPLKGFAAVTAACFTSGLAGVYFEMVLKNSKADLWIRNVQLSLFSLIPALLPVIYSSQPKSLSSVPPSAWPLGDLFKNFGAWAWATVAIQVFGGLLTALVIKYSDNIMKGFATSLSIILSFLASVVLFHFKITPGFMVGSITVLVATWMYNQPPVTPLPIIRDSAIAHSSPGAQEKELVDSSSLPWSPIEKNEPIIGEKVSPSRRSASFLASASSSTQSVASFFGLTPQGHEKLSTTSTSPAASIRSAQSEDEAATYAYNAYAYSKSFSGSLSNSLSSSRSQLYMSSASLGSSPYASRSGSPSLPRSEPTTPIVQEPSWRQ